MVQIPEIKDPFERYCAFLAERDSIYWKKTTGHPKPWTQDEILQNYKFTEVYRERDRTSIHYQKTVREQYQGSALILPATVLYRWFNRISTCNALFNEPELDNQTTFERYINNGCEDISILFDFIRRTPTPHVTGAFIIQGKPNYEKGFGVMMYFHEWCQKPWEEAWEAWNDSPPTLADMFHWLQECAPGLGSFMTAQLVADLKYLPFMVDAVDWWTWASPGPGSMRGLNVVYDQPMFQPWKPAEWLKQLQVLRDAENIALKPYGLGPFHAQDTQNHCCEFSKYTKTMLNMGRPRERYHGV